MSKTFYNPFIKAPIKEEKRPELVEIVGSEIGEEIDKSKPHRHYVFTINNPEEKWNAETSFHEKVKYCVFSLEKAPKTGTLHYQGYVELSCPQRLSWMKKNFHPTAHYEARRGSREQARAYCMESVKKGEPILEGPFEFGEWKESNQGKRTDLEIIAECVKKGIKTKDILEMFPGNATRYINQIMKTKSYFPVKRTWKTEVIVFWGETGLGKSAIAHKWAEENAPNGDYYKVCLPRDDKKLWWDGYDNHEVVIIDEFKGQISWHEMLELCDRYPYMGQTKGGMVSVAPKIIIITSNFHPKDWYPNEKYKLLERRILRVSNIINNIVTVTEVAGNTRQYFQENLAPATLQQPLDFSKSEIFKMKEPFEEGPKVHVPSKKGRKEEFDDNESVTTLFVDEDGNEIVIDLNEEEIPEGFVEDPGAGYENDGEESQETVLYNENGEPIGYHEEIVDVPSVEHQDMFEKMTKTFNRSLPRKNTMGPAQKLTGYKRIESNDGSITFKRDRSGTDNPPIINRDIAKKPGNVEVEVVNVNPPASQ